jgi:hypothetical protein
LVLLTWRRVYSSATTTMVAEIRPPINNNLNSNIN